MQLRQRLEYKKGDETNISFWSHSFWLGLHVFGEKKRGRRGRRRGRRDIRYVFVLELCIFWISRVFGIDYWTFGPLYGFPWFLGS